MFKSKESVFAFVLGVVITLCVVWFPNQGGTYEMCSVVTGIAGDVVTVRDDNHNYFRFNMTDDHNFHVGDFVELTMDTNGTAGNPVDDRVIDAVII